MSRLWRERYIAVIGSGRVGLCRRAGKETTWLGSSGCDTEQAPSANDVLAVLERLLLAHASPGAELQVVLSGIHTRIFLVPWREQISSLDELQAYARMCFDDIYSTQGEAWLIRVSPDSEGQQRLACAISLELERSLRAVAQACGFKLVSVQPYLMVAVNCFRPRISETSYLFILTEPGRITALLVSNGQWAAVRSASHAGDCHALNRLVERERELQQLANEPIPAIYLHAPGQDEAALQMSVQPQWLSLALPRLAQRDALYVMAQTVI